MTASGSALNAAVTSGIEMRSVARLDDDADAVIQDAPRYAGGAYIRRRRGAPGSRVA